MTHYTTDKYRIDIYADQTFTEGSADNVNQYDFVYFDNSEYHFPSVFGIKTFKDDTLIKSAVIGSIGGGTGIRETSTIIENDRLLICCLDSVFCLSIPDLTLLWRTKADQATCFEIYKYQDSYIIHGELEISRLDKDGKILWQQSGADIFTTLDGKDTFTITDKYILATDWENRKYKFDFNGIIIMTKQEQIYNWLTTGLQQPADRLSEIFYYDKRDNEFFSILVTDYFMFDENLDVAEDTTTTYTKENLETLIDRIKRIEKKDVAIISLPRLGNSANVDDTEFISQQAESFLNLNSISIETVTIWEVEENGTITIDLKNKSKSVTKKPWWKVWK